MNNRDFFKEVLKPQMPDLEKVKKDITNQKVTATTVAKKRITLNFTVKRLIPAVACVAIIAISVFSAIYSENSDSVKILRNNGYESVTANTENTEKTTEEDNRLNYQGDINRSEENTSGEDISQNETTTAYLTENNFFSKNLVQKSSFSFNSYSDLKAFAKGLKSEDSKIIFTDGENEYEFFQAKESVSMILDEKVIYSVNYNSSRLDCGGDIKKMSSNSLVCCVFYAMDNNNEYNIYYSLSKSNDLSGSETFTSESGYTYYISSNTFKTNIDGYCFYITTTADINTAKVYINKISFVKESL